MSSISELADRARRHAELVAEGARRGKRVIAYHEFRGSEDIVLCVWCGMRWDRTKSVEDAGAFTGGQDICGMAP